MALTRLEKDSLGALEVPADAYYGVQSLRASRNFPVSGLRPHPVLVRAYAQVKKACARANLEAGRLAPAEARAILDACDELAAGRFYEQFVVDVYQAGAGTSFNMNVNEVIANRALELLGQAKGDYLRVHPNDHVNMSQSTNDTYPTALRVALLWKMDELGKAVGGVARALDGKGREFARVRKAARTHLRDAVPTTLGREFDAYAAAVRACLAELTRRAGLLRAVPLGATAAGTGATAPPGFRRKAVGLLARGTGLPLVPQRDLLLGLQSHQPFCAFSGALKDLALELVRVSNDLRLLSSGPATGLAEIGLPPVQPGSSIMPGKANPSMLECLCMVCFQLAGRDLAVSLAAQAGQLDLNVMTPLTAYDLVDSVELLIRLLPEVERRCLRGIRADEVRCRAYAERTPSLAALLAPRLGHARAAELYREAVARETTVRAVALEKRLLPEEELDRLLAG